MIFTFCSPLINLGHRCERDSINESNSFLRKYMMKIFHFRSMLYLHCLLNKIMCRASRAIHFFNFYIPYRHFINLMYRHHTVWPSNDFLESLIKYPPKSFLYIISNFFWHNSKKNTFHPIIFLQIIKFDFCVRGKIYFCYHQMISYR